MAKTAYRSDIDGLRALAVLVIVFFHTGWGFPGGFVGVDVFFVISGFLITRLIAADLDRGKFSLAAFWDRRIRRIWPAALVTTAVTLAIGWWTLLPADLNELGSNAAAQILMVANIRAWRNGADYFGTESEFNPLLHMWSLAVEEQFYMFLPLVMMLVWPLGPRWRVGVLSALGLASFLASLFFIQHYRMAVFFLLPFRAWELLLGSILSLSPQLLPQDRISRQTLGLAGLLMIANSCFFYNHRTLFPGLNAIAPCLGAAAVIAAGGGTGSTISRWLEAPLLNIIGRMSYSIYLWHWPLLVLLRYSVGPTLTLPLAAAAMASLAVISYLSYRWIEGPCRAAVTPLARRRVVWSAILASLAILGCFGLIRRYGGFPSRFPRRVLEPLHAEQFPLNWEWKPSGSSAGGFALKAIGAKDATSPDSFLFFGDSHGMAISSVVDFEASQLGLSGQAALKRTTLPLPGHLEAVKHNTTAHSDWYDSVAAWVKQHRPKQIILCARWSRYMPDFIPDDSRDLPFQASGSTADALNTRAIAAIRTDVEEVIRLCEQTDATLWVLLEVPYQPQTPRERTIAAYWSGKNPSVLGIDRATHDRRMHSFHEAIAGLNSPRLHIVDLSLPFFNGEDRSQVGREGLLWYFDDDHLNPKGAREVLGPTLRAILEAAVGESGNPPPLPPPPPVG